MNDSDYFSINDGMKVQQSDLARWKRVLNDDAFVSLQQECVFKNAELNPKADGHDVFRGDDMMQFIINLTYMLK